MIENLFENLMNGVFYLVGWITNFLLTPINALLVSFLPANSINSLVSNVNSFWDSLVRPANWFLGATGIYNSTLTIIKLMFVYMLTAPLLIRGVKLALSWFRTLKI